MPLRWITFLIAAVLGVAILVGLAGPAGAHNSLLGSEPAEDSAVPAVATQIVLRFASPAPLDTASIEVIDAAGSRVELAGLTHRPGGDSEIVGPLPTLAAGAVTVRWRLVGPDGHPLTGRVGFSIVAANTAAAAASAATPATETPIAAEFDEPWRAPGAVRWFLRWASYLAMIGLGGIVAAAAWLLPSCWRLVSVRSAALSAAAVVGVLGVAQLLTLSGDIVGRSPLAAWGNLGAAFGTTAGRAFAIRVAVAIAVAVALTTRSLAKDVRWMVTGGLVLVLLATWAYAGHARSMRWAVLGVPLDVAHHGAAAVWLGGLVVVGRLGLAGRTAATVVQPVQRFAQLAPIAVGVLIGTGIAQSIRLTGMPDLSLGSTYTRLLFVKLIALALMLKLADFNRKRVTRRFSNVAMVTPNAIWALRRAMTVELCVGLVIVGLTAAMVVSPPPAAAADAALVANVTSATAPG